MKSTRDEDARSFDRENFVVDGNCSKIYLEKRQSLFDECCLSRETGMSLFIAFSML